MSNNNDTLHGELNIPVTEALRAQFTECTQQFEGVVSKDAQYELLNTCMTSEGTLDPAATLELLDHLLVTLGMSYEDIYAPIRTATSDTRGLSVRVESMRTKERGRTSVLVEEAVSA